MTQWSGNDDVAAVFMSANYEQGWNYLFVMKANDPWKILQWSNSGRKCEKKVEK